MTTHRHQWLLLWAIRRMELDGFSLIGADGRIPTASYLRPLTSRPVCGYRPDATGISPGADTLAYCEAKTCRDINNAHTRKQLLIVRDLMAVGLCARLYLAVPRPSSWDLDRVLQETGMLGIASVVRIHVPDSLIEEIRL